MAFTDDAIYTLRAKTRGEAIGHCYTRAGFLPHIIRDERTRRLFATWGALHGLDQAIGLAQPILDRAAQRAGLADRAVFRSDGRALYNAIGHLEDRYLMLQLLEHVETQLSVTREIRARDVLGFILAELYGGRDDPAGVSICGWLGSDLLTIFDEEVACQVWGTPLRFGVPVSPTRDAVPKGQRPKGSAAHLARYAHWYYLAKIQEPLVMIPELAKAYADDCLSRAPKDRGSISQQPDTAEVRYGIRRAEYFLTLPIPPGRWADFCKCWPDRGGKTQD